MRPHMRGHPLLLRSRHDSNHREFTPEERGRRPADLPWRISKEYSSETGLAVRSPIDGGLIANVRSSTAADVAAAVGAAHDAFLQWRHVPAPRRGELVRLLGQELRRVKTALGRLISIEAGKSVSEGLGEVQEAIDICDYASVSPASCTATHCLGASAEHSHDGDVAPRRRMWGDHSVQLPIGVCRGTPRSYLSAATAWSGALGKKRRFARSRRSVDPNAQ